MCIAARSFEESLGQQDPKEAHKQRVLQLLQAEFVPLVLQLAEKWGIGEQKESEKQQQPPSITIQELFTSRAPPAQLLAKYMDQAAHAHSFPHIVAHSFSSFFIEQQAHASNVSVVENNANGLEERAKDLLTTRIVAALDDPKTTNITLKVA